MPKGIPSPTKVCSVDGCENPHGSRGWCGKHYARFRRTGDPLGVRRPSPEGRFWSKVDKAGPLPKWAPFLGPCWLWTGHLDRYGYANFGLGKHRMVKVHRFAYELLVGPIPEGLEIDHLCRVRHCVNPAHMEPVTHAENMARGPSYFQRAAA